MAFSNTVILVILNIFCCIIFGKTPSIYCFSVAVINGVRKLLTYAAEGASKIPPNNTHDEYVFVASNAIDGSLETYPQKCFISDKQFNGFAEFHIPISMVTHVEVLNVGENGKKLL